MSETVSTGPTISAGPLLGTPDVPDNNPLYGPDASYQGSSIPDVRFPIPGGGIFPAGVKGHLDSPYMLQVDAIPAAANAAAIAAAANVTSGTAMTLTTGTVAGASAAIPFYAMTTATTGTVTYPVMSSTLVTSGLTLDLGYTTATTTAATAVITPASMQFPFYQGQYIILDRGGNSGGTLPLVTQITGVLASTLTVSPAPLFTGTCRLGNTNVLWTRSDLVNFPSTMGWSPYLYAGSMALLNPLDTITRGVSITGSASATGGAFKVKGYDLYGMPMNETITATAGATTKYGNKAFKHIVSVTPQFTDAHNYSVGTSDVYGCAMRTDRWEYINAYSAATFFTLSSGWTAGDTTNPATATTGDVRGTIQIGALGPIAAGAAGSPSQAASPTGSTRIAFFATQPLYNLVASSPTNPATMYGQIQF